MKKYLLTKVFFTIMTVFHGVCLYASMESCDFSDPRDGDIDGRDISWFVDYYFAGNLLADVDETGTVDSIDVAHFAGYYGLTYPVVPARPNILLIIADDVGLDLTTSLYPNLITGLTNLYGPSGWNHPAAGDIDGTPASTPVLDQFARQAMVFSNAWAQPFCSPTRAAVITGLYAKKTNVTAPGNPMSVNHTTFVQLLKNNDYNTALFGKWHLGAGGTTGVLPKQVGFDIFKGHTGGDLWRWSFWNYSYHVQDEATADPTTVRTESAPTRSLEGVAATTFAPVVRAADTIAWITAQEAQNPDKPWFVWLAFNEVHTPMHVPNVDTIDPASYAEVTGCGGVPGTTDRGSCSDKVIIRAMTNAIDTVIGKVLDAIKDPNTYIIFVGDNGTDNAVGPTRSLGIDNMYLNRTAEVRGKGTAHESGARVPMAIRGPGITAGGASSEFVHAADLFATCLELAGITPPTTNKNYTTPPVDVASDSVSLAPILFGEQPTVRDPNEGYILTETDWVGSKKVGARNATYKVLCTDNADNCLFFNLSTDPLEEYELAKPNCVSPDPNWTTDDAEWHYCRLIEVVNTYSIF
jgi:arylsulfatase A-like enzyme